MGEGDEVKSIICRLRGGHEPVQVIDTAWKGKRIEQQDGYVECSRCGERLPDGTGGVYRPVLMPKMSVVYWRRKPLINEIVPTECDFCDQEIKPGGHYFIIMAHTSVTQEGETINEIELRGHLEHLVYAPPVEWMPKGREE